MLLIELLVLMVKLEAVQFAVAKVVFCCKAKPAEGYGHVTMRPLLELRTVSRGASVAMIALAAWAEALLPAVVKLPPT